MRLPLKLTFLLVIQYFPKTKKAGLLQLFSIYFSSYNPITGIESIKIFSFSSRPSRGSMIPGLLG